MKNVVDGYTVLARKYEKILGSTSMVAPAEINAFFDSLPASSKVLDAGSGPGIESKIGFDAGHEMIGLDITPEMITRYREAFPEARAVVADMTSIPLKANEVDAVLVASSLLHLDQEKGTQAIREFARVTKPNGLLAIGTTVGDGQGEFHSRPLLTDAGVESLYFFHWKREELRQAIESAGYEITQWSERVLVENRPKWVFITATLHK